MFVEALSKFGGDPVRLEASQFVVRNDAGTPIVVGGEYGPDGAVKVAHAGDRDFNSALKAFGYGHADVVVERIKGPGPAPGSRPLSSPR